MASDPSPPRLPVEIAGPWVLLLLRLRPTYGYELRQRLTQLGFGVDSTWLYRHLERMENDGIVRSEWRAATSVGPRRRLYRVTAKGTRRIHNDAEALEVVRHALRAYFGDYGSLTAQLERRRTRAP